MIKIGNFRKHFGGQGKDLWKSSLLKSSKNTVNNCENQLFQNSGHWPETCNSLGSVYSRKNGWILVRTSVHLTCSHKPLWFCGGTPGLQLTTGWREPGSHWGVGEEWDWRPFKASSQRIVIMWSICGPQMSMPIVACHSLFNPDFWWRKVLSFNEVKCILVPFMASAFMFGSELLAHPKGVKRHMESGWVDSCVRLAVTVNTQPGR